MNVRILQKRHIARIVCHALIFKVKEVGEVEEEREDQYLCHENTYVDSSRQFS